jgi:hypothetical protein
MADFTLLDFDPNDFFVDVPEKTVRMVQIRANLKLTTSGGVISRQRYTSRLYSIEGSELENERLAIVALTPAGGTLDMQNNNILTTVNNVNASSVRIAPSVDVRKVADLTQGAWDTLKTDLLALLA